LTAPLFEAFQDGPPSYLVRLGFGSVDSCGNSRSRARAIRMGRFDVDSSEL
jgi:hypothetical protein